MKKTYICPAMLSVELRTKNSILTISGGNTGTLGIIDDDLSSTNDVWTKEHRNSVWDNEW